MVIQRIQSLLLLLAVIAMGLFCFTTLNYVEPGQAVKVFDNPDYLSPAAAAFLLNLYSIFLYKRMKIQRKTVALAGVISLVLLVCNLFGQFTSSEAMATSAPVYLFIASMFDWLAIRGINKDARLLADSNRLR